MQLSAAALWWIIKRVLVFATIVAVLFGGSLLVKLAVSEFSDFTAVAQTDENLKQVRADRATKEEELQVTEEGYAERVEATKNQTLDELTASTRDIIDKLKNEIVEKKKEIDRLDESLCDGWAEFWEGAGDIIGFETPCAIKKKAFQEAKEQSEQLTEHLNVAKGQLEMLQDPALTPDERLEKVGRSLGEFEDPLFEDQITKLKKEVKALEDEEEGLLRAQDHWVWFVIEQWRSRWMWVVGIALALLLMRPLTKVFNYFVMMPLVTRAAKPLRLSPGEGEDRAQIVVGPAERSLGITLAPGEVLSARAQHLRDVQGTVKATLLYKMRAPFISFAAGLNGHSRVTPNEGGAHMTISDPEESDSYVMRIDFQDHPGLVMHPKHVVGLIGSPRLTTRWRWGWHFLATGQARYILFTGSGSLLVQGISDIIARTPSGEGSKMEQSLVMGFDSRLTVNIKRTENFFSYFVGKEPLVDKVFSGPYPYFWQKTATDGTKNAIEKGFDTFFSAIGKVFGF